MFAQTIITQCTQFSPELRPAKMCSEKLTSLARLGVKGFLLLLPELEENQFCESDETDREDRWPDNLYTPTALIGLRELLTNSQPCRSTRRDADHYNATSS